MFTSGTEGGVPMTAKELAKRRARRVVAVVIAILVIAFMSFVGLIGYAGMGTSDIEKGSLAYHFFLPAEITDMPLYGVCAPPRYSMAPGQPAEEEGEDALPAQAVAVYGTTLDAETLFARYDGHLKDRGCRPAEWCAAAKDPKACYVCLGEDFPWMRRVHVAFPGSPMPAAPDGKGGDAASDGGSDGGACRRAFVAVSE